MNSSPESSMFSPLVTASCKKTLLVLTNHPDNLFLEAWLQNCDEVMTSQRDDIQNWSKSAVSGTWSKSNKQMMDCVNTVVFANGNFAYEFSNFYTSLQNS